MLDVKIPIWINIVFAQDLTVFQRKVIQKKGCLPDWLALEVNKRWRFGMQVRVETIYYCLVIMLLLIFLVV